MENCFLLLTWWTNRYPNLSVHRPSKMAQLREVAGFEGARIGLPANVDSSLSQSINPPG